jgi:hypothetical protein
LSEDVDKEDEFEKKQKKMLKMNNMKNDPPTEIILIFNQRKSIKMKMKKKIRLRISSRYIYP